MVAQCHQLLIKMRGHTVNNGWHLCFWCVFHTRGQPLIFVFCPFWRWIISLNQLTALHLAQPYHFSCCTYSRYQKVELSVLLVISFFFSRLFTCFALFLGSNAFLSKMCSTTVKWTTVLASSLHRRLEALAQCAQELSLQSWVKKKKVNFYLDGCHGETDLKPCWDAEIKERSHLCWSRPAPSTAEHSNGHGSSLWPPVGAAYLHSSGTVATPLTCTKGICDADRVALNANHTKALLVDNNR